MPIKKNDKQIQFAANKYADQVMEKLAPQLHAEGKPPTADELASVKAIVGLTAGVVLNDLNQRGQLK